MQHTEAYRVLVDQAVCGMSIIQDDHPVFVNQTLVDMLGYTPEQLKALSVEQALAFLAPQYRDDAIRFYRAVRDGLPGLHKHILEINREGQTWWGEVILKSIEYQGRPAVYAVLQDAGERKSREIDLHRYKNIISGTDDGISLVNRDYVYQIVNDSYLERYDRCRDEIEGHHVAEVIGEATFQEVIKPHLDRCFAGETVRYDAWFNYSKFGRCYVQVTYTPYRDDSGEIIGAVANAHDMTDYKRIEDDLRESKNLYQSLVDSLPLNIYRIDLNGHVTFANKTLLGELPPEDIIGKTAYDVYPPDLARKYRQDDARVIEHGETLRLTEEHADPVTKKRSHVEVIKIPIYDSENTIEGIQGVFWDVTERKEMEVQLREANARYDELVRHVPALVYVARLTPDDEFSFDYLSPRCKKFTGYEAEEVMADPTLLRSNLSPEEDERHWQLTLESREKMEQFLFESEIMVNGEKHWIRLSSYPRRMENGDIVWHGIHTDVTARKQAELALEASRKTMHRLIQQIPIGIQVFDTNGLCIDVNQAHLDIFGVKRDNLVGHYNIMTDPLAERMTTRAAARRTLQGETMHLGDLEFHFEYADARYASVSSETRTINVILVPLFDENGQVSGFVGVNMDITERKKMEQQLRKAHRQYQELADSITDIFFAMDEQLNYTFWNQASEKLTGIRAEDALGKSLYELFPVVKDTEVDRVYQEVLQTGQTRTTEMYYETDGQGLYFENRVYPSEQGISVISRDVTALKEKQQRELELTLEQERSQLLREFVQDIAHEFRTSLTLINTGAYILGVSDSEAMRRKQLENISSATVDLTTLLNSMLKMVQLDYEQLPERKPVELNDVLRMTLESLIVEIHDNDLNVLTNYAKEDLVVSGDFDHLQTALRHLVKNAIQFTPESSTIMITTRRLDDSIVIRVKDSGQGISDQAMPHIFKHFYREDSARTRRGFGLGLPMALKIIELHGGTITAKNNKNRGATFTVTLPVEVQ